MCTIFWLALQLKVHKIFIRVCLVLSLSIRKVWPSSSLLMCCMPKMDYRCAKMISSQPSEWPCSGWRSLLVNSGWKQTLSFTCHFPRVKWLESTELDDSTGWFSISRINTDLVNGILSSGIGRGWWEAYALLCLTGLINQEIDLSCL